MLYQTTGVQLKSVRRNNIRKASQFDRYIGTAFMLLTVGTCFLAVIRMIVRH